LRKRFRVRQCSVSLLANVGAGANVGVDVGVKHTAMLGEVPLNSHVGKLTLASSEVKGNDGSLLLRAARHGFTGGDVGGRPLASCLSAAPRLPGNILNYASRVAAITNRGWLNGAVALL